MDIEEKIKAYQVHSRQIMQAIENNDEAEIVRLDHLLDQAFKTIVNLESDDPNTRIAQAKCLLDYLLPESDRSKTQQNICNKILSINHSQNK